MAHNYAHQNDPLNAYVIRDLLVNHFPQDSDWGTVREYVDWGIEYHLSNGGYMPESGNVYGIFYRVLEKFVSEGKFEKYKESRRSYYKPIPVNEVEVLLNIICGVHDDLFEPISIIESLITRLEDMRTELEDMRTEFEGVRTGLESQKTTLATILDAHNM